MTTCEYGCGREATFVLKNGKNCCSSFANKCEAIRAKNASSLKEAYEKGNRNSTFCNEHRRASLNKRRNNSIVELLKENVYASNHAVKNVLLNSLNWDNKCSVCGVTEWCNRELLMELDHINGLNSDNRIENLRLLCPNCHSQTITYCGKAKNIGKTKVSDEELKKALVVHKNVRQALIAVKLTPKGGNYTRAYKLLSTLKEI